MVDRIVWPAWMPNPQSSGYTFQPVDRRAKSDMEIGGIVRNEFDTDETRLSCRLVLDQGQAQFFEAFQKQILKTGTRWFELSLWIAGELKTHLVRFSEHPKLESIMGLHTVYSLSLQVSRRHLLPEWVTEILLKYNPRDLRRWSARLHIVLHEEMPGTLVVPAWGE